MNLDAIKPDASGKYSPLLYKWLSSKRSRMFKYEQVFQTGSFLDRSIYDDHWRMIDIIIGNGSVNKGVGGRSLRSIVGGERGVKSLSYHYGPGFSLREITDEFWAEYERIGRCVWDHDHTLPMIGHEKRFTVSDDGRQRLCNWCGRHFEVEERTVVEVSRRVSWREFKHSVPAIITFGFGSLGEEAA